MNGIIVLMIVLVRGLKNCIHAWEFVFVNSGIFYSFIVLEHAWVIDLCWLISLLTWMFSTWECWWFAHAWVIDLCWSIDCYMYVLSTWEMLTNFFMRCEILVVLGKESSSVVHVFYDLRVYVLKTHVFSTYVWSMGLYTKM